MKNTKERTERNKVEVQPLDLIRHEERISRITDDIVAGMSRVKILDKYTKLWECGKNTINTIYQEACIKMSEEYRTNKEEVRTISNIRLEGVWDGAKTVSQKLKTIDLINKTNNVYDNNVVVSTGEDGFIFDIGVEDLPAEEEDAYDDHETHDQE